MLHIKARRGSCQVLSEVERQRPVQWAPRMLTQECREAWVKLGEARRRGGNGAGSFHGVTFGALLLLFLSSSHGCDSQRHLCGCTRGRLLGQRGHGRWDHSLLPTRSIPGECAFHGSKKPGHPPGRCPRFGRQRLSCKASLKATDKAINRDLSKHLE